MMVDARLDSLHILESVNAHGLCVDGPFERAVQDTNDAHAMKHSGIVKEELHCTSSGVTNTKLWQRSSVDSNGRFQALV